MVNERLRFRKGRTLGPKCRTFLKPHFFMQRKKKRINFQLFCKSIEHTLCMCESHSVMTQCKLPVISPPHQIYKTFSSNLQVSPFFTIYDSTTLLDLTTRLVLQHVTINMCWMEWTNLDFMLLLRQLWKCTNLKTREQRDGGAMSSPRTW